MNRGYGKGLGHAREYSSNAGDSSTHFTKDSDSSDLSASDQAPIKSGRILLNAREVAELLGLSVGHVYHLVSQKRITCVKLSSRCVRFRRCDIDAWIASLVHPAE